MILYLTMDRQSDEDGPLTNHQIIKSTLELGIEVEQIQEKQYQIQL